MAKTLKIMIVAGEASGDTHAAKLVAAMREACPDTSLEFFGSAGPKMRAAGVEPTVDADGMSIVGLLEIAAALPMFIRVFNQLKAAAAEKKPSVVILVDLPEFNLRLARTLKRMGLTVVYYISPQLWAWRKYRLRTVSKYVDLMLTILPFEQEWYESHGFDRVRYVGSPLVREINPGVSKKEFCERHGFYAARPLIALLPGSREREIARILPVLIKSASVMRQRRGDVQFMVPVSSEDHAAVADDIGASTISADEMRPVVIVGKTHDALNAADAAAVTSGTATLEAAIIGTPMVVIYRTPRLNYLLFEPMIGVPHYGLVNLIAGKRLAAELIQNDLTPERLADE